MTLLMMPDTTCTCMGIDGPSVAVSSNIVPDLINDGMLHK